MFQQSIINSRASFRANSENWRRWLDWPSVGGLVCLFHMNVMLAHICLPFFFEQIIINSWVPFRANSKKVLRWLLPLEFLIVYLPFCFIQSPSGQAKTFCLGDWFDSCLVVLGVVLAPWRVGWRLQTVDWSHGFDVQCGDMAQVFLWLLLALFCVQQILGEVVWSGGMPRVQDLKGILLGRPWWRLLIQSNRSHS